MPRAHVVPDGSKLTALRAEADLTQLELARQAGYGLRTIGKIENSQPTGTKTLAAAATVLSRRLGRAVTLTDLMKRPGGVTNAAAPTTDGAGLVEEMVRFLDLSELAVQRPGNERLPVRRAVLVDHFRFGRFGRFPAQQPALCFPYFALAERAYGACLSHPEQSRWWAVGDAAPLSGKPRRGYRMQVDLPSAAMMESPVICNGIEYIGAFAGETGDVLEVPVVWPTEELTVHVLFPRTRPCRSVRGRPEGTLARPLVLPGGKLVHWRISSPPVGVTYRLEWEW